MKPLEGAYRLVCHADNSATGVDAVEVDIQRRAPAPTRLLYRVSGDVSSLQIPEQAKPARCNGLWRHTCFELFVAGAGTDYFEFNFSPSLQWAAYRFDSYREAMADLHLTSPPHIRVEHTPGSLTLDARIELPESTPSEAGEPPRMALAAIIESRDGNISYWALAHPAGKPDFHHPDGFVGVLPDNGA